MVCNEHFRFLESSSNQATKCIMKIEQATNRLLNLATIVKSSYSVTQVEADGNINLDVNIIGQNIQLEAANLMKLTNHVNTRI